MLAASNTSPISNLAIIGHLALLRSQFEAIWIPEAVQAELRAVPNPSAAASIAQAFREGWITLRAVCDERIVRLLEAGLHRGEAEAIALGLELPADLVLLDERAGRSAAERLGLRVTGVLGILLRAKMQGSIPRLESEIEALRNQAHFFIAARLEDQLLRSAGE
jgi:hypothetical protein